jgi:hypothetical protein
MAVRTHGTVHEVRGRCEGEAGTQHLLAQHHGAQGKGRAAGNVRADERGQGQGRSQWATTRSTRAQDWREASPRNTTSHAQKLVARPQAKQTHHVLTHTDTKHAQRHRHTLTAKTEEQKKNKEKIPPRLGVLILPTAVVTHTHPRQPPLLHYDAGGRGRAADRTTGGCCCPGRPAAGPGGPRGVPPPPTTGPRAPTPATCPTGRGPPPAYLFLYNNNI